MDIIIEVEVPNLQSNNLNLTVIITSKNLVSNEIFTVENLVTFKLLNRSIWDYLMDYIMVIIIGLIGLVWILAFIYIKRINKKLEAPSKQLVTPRRPRKGKYVKVSELKPIPKKAEEEAKAQRHEKHPKRIE